MMFRFCFSSPELKVQVSYSDRLLYVRPSVCLSVNFSHFHLLLHNQWANFKQTWQKASVGGEDSSLFNWIIPPFSKRNSETTLTNLKKIFFSRTNGPISTKLGTKHPWVKNTHVCSNESLCPFPKGNNNKIARLHWQNKKKFFSRTTGQITTKLGTKHPWVKGIQVYPKWRVICFSKGRW